MIRYGVELADIERRIDEALPATLTKRGTLRKGGRRSWRDRARERTEQFRAAGRYNDADGAEFWGEVKPILAVVQKNKCAFCESCLYNRASGATDGDVEHFRPKRRGDNYAADVPTGGSHLGYHLLAYDAGNYVLACRTCNQDYKKAYFPIAGPRVTTGNTSADYAAEEPFLIYPLGTTDTNPEKVLQFTGIIPDPVDSKASNSHNYWRARITIDLFNLERREDLRRERAKVIRTVFMALLTQDAEAQAGLETALADSADHANCARSFKRLFDTDKAKAREIVKEAIALLRDV